MTQYSHAIVIGGSMAGLLAARALSDTFDKVSIIERDTLPENPDFRKGVPQAHHLHTLLAQGETVLSEFFPNITQEMEELGALYMRWGIDTPTLTSKGWVKRFDSGIASHTITRIKLEWLVRQRVGQLHNVEFCSQIQVESLIADDKQSKVIGMNIRSRRTQETDSLYADLVVDASGRSSKAPEWLKSLGYDEPAETIINPNLGYATRWFKKPDDISYDWKAIVIQARPQEGLHRGGGAMVMEDNQVIVTLAGVNKDYPPTDETEFLEFAKSLASPVLYDLMLELEPTSAISSYRRTSNRQLHYEKLSRLPENFIVMGDAACAFNPIYGQGMTIASLEAKALNQMLRIYTDMTKLDGLSKAFQKRLAEVVQDAWIMATGEDLRFPETEGSKPNIIDRLTQKYVDVMIPAFTEDEVLAAAFLKTMNLTISPIALMNPRLLGRVIKFHLSRKQADNVADVPFQLMAN